MADKTELSDEYEPTKHDRYNRSRKGRARHHRYNTSTKGKDRKIRYNDRRGNSTSTPTS